MMMPPIDPKGVTARSVSDEAIQGTIHYLSSEAALVSLRSSPYWPKWNSPWWHMVALHEMGLADLIPRETAESLVQAIARQYPQNDHQVSTTPCPCELGNIFQVLSAVGIDVDRELPWVRPWLLSRQMTDGGLSCDDDAYHAQPQASSMVGTIAPLEAILLHTPRSFTPEEERFLDSGARCLIERKLMLGCLAPHNAEERLDQDDWLKPCFPRFYFYDVLRGLAFVLRWAEVRNQCLPRSAISGVIQAFVGGFPDGDISVERHAFEGVGTRILVGPNKWERRAQASLFPLLEEVSEIGRFSPYLTLQWRAAKDRLDRLSRQGMLE